MDLEELRKEMDDEVNSGSFKDKLKRKNKKDGETSSETNDKENFDYGNDNLSAENSKTASDNKTTDSGSVNNDGEKADTVHDGEKELPDWAKSSKNAKPQKKGKKVKHKKNPISPAVAIIFLLISTAAAVGTVFLCYWAYDAMKIILTQTGPAVIIFFFFCWTPFIIPLLTAIATVITYTMALTCGIMSRHSVLGKVILVIALIPVIALILVIILLNV